MNKAKRPSGVSMAFKQTLAIDNLKKGISAPKFTIKIANSLEEREAAYRLAYQVYLDKGYITTNPNEWLIKPQDADPDTTTLIVQDINKNVVGTATIIFDGYSVLPAQAIYFSEINTLRSRKEKIAEISRLAINPDYRNSKEILVLLFNYLYIYSFYVKNYTCLTIEVNPRHTAYYEALLNFRVIGNEKPCPFVQRAPAILMFAPLKQGQIEVLRYSKLTESEKKTRSLFPFFVRPNQESLVAIYLAKQFKSMTADEKIYFGFTDSTVGQAILTY